MFLRSNRIQFVFIIHIKYKICEELSVRDRIEVWNRKTLYLDIFCTLIDSLDSWDALKMSVRAKNC